MILLSVGKNTNIKNCWSTAMYKLRPFVNLQIMNNIYHSLFYSHVIYGIHVWGKACGTHKSNTNSSK